jgi:hypothetical protein
MACHKLLILITIRIAEDWRPSVRPSQTVPRLRGRDHAEGENADRGLPTNTPTAGHCPREQATGNAYEYQAIGFLISPERGITLT